jgi:hypothetical protein
MSPVRYELGFYITEGDILHSHRRDNLKSYLATDVDIFPRCVPESRLMRCVSFRACAG